MAILRYFALLATIAIGGCATPPVPQLDPQKSTGIGINIALRPPIGLYSQVPQAVYFVKLDDELELRQPVVVRSSYSTDGRVYLLNAPAGHYAAVAAFFYRPTPIAMPGAPPPQHSLGGRLGFITYFPEEMVKQTRVNLVKGQFVFSGSYVVDQSLCCKNNDSIQRHYARVLSWRATRNWPDPWRTYSIDYEYTGSVREARRDEASATSFLGKARGDLAVGGWAAIIK